MNLHYLIAIQSKGRETVVSDRMAFFPAPEILFPAGPD
jgi:hypothetical protein